MVAKAFFLIFVNFFYLKIEIERLGFITQVFPTTLGNSKTFFHSFVSLHTFLKPWMTLRAKQSFAIEIFHVKLISRVSKYLQHDQLYTNLQLKKSGRRARTEREKKEFMAMEINSLYLGASVLLCTSYLFCWTPKKSRKLARKLAALVDIDKNDLRLMADVLFAMAVQVEDGNY